MKKKFERIGGKILLGYAVIIVIAICSLSYIYTMIDRVVSDSDVDFDGRQKVYLVSNTQSLLYESEALGQLIDMPEDDYTYFHETLDKAVQNMESLRLLVSDSLFQYKIDTITTLIEQKRKNTNDLLQIWNEANSDLYEKNIQAALRSDRADVKETEIQERSNVQTETVIVPAQRRSFLRRLAEVFVPSDRDSSIVVSANQEVLKDSTVNVYNPNEAISSTLRNIQSNVATERERLRELLVDRSAAIRYDNSLISAKINQILRDIEEDELNASLQQMQRKQDLLSHTSYVISVIALISGIVALFFLFFIGRDLSKSQYYRKQLEKEKRYTEDLLNSREKLILTIGHDIRAPLSSIIGYIELLQRSLPDERQRMYLSNMSGSSSHILSLVNDLLDYQRLESGQIEIHKLPFRITALFDEIYNSFRPQAAAKELNMTLQLNDVSDTVFMSDSIRIRQIVGNLLSNGIKFTDEGGVGLIVDGSKLTPDAQPMLRITVCDTGTGIAPEEQERVFNEFTRLRGTEKIEGFGLGLSITHKLITLLEGTIELESEEGKGSSFTVSIPLEVAENQQFVDAPKEEDDSSVQYNGRAVTCMIVDDDLLQIVLMEEMLKQHQIQVVSCANPRLVLEQLGKIAIDMLITDIQMPGMNGYDLVKQIRDSDLPNAQTLPVVALSATVDKELKRYLDAGFTAALSKPFTSKQLVELFNRLLPVKLETTDELDFSSLVGFAEGDKGASESILRTFSLETNKSIDLLEEALAAADREKSARISHKMVPLLTMLGATTVVQQLRVLERNDMELSDSGWRHLLTDAIKQIRLIVEYAEAAD